MPRVTLAPVRARAEVRSARTFRQRLLVMPAAAGVDDVKRRLSASGSAGTSAGDAVERPRDLADGRTQIVPLLPRQRVHRGDVVGAPRRGLLEALVKRFSWTSVDPSVF